jgi:hypothetical protein
MMTTTDARAGAATRPAHSLVRGAIGFALSATLLVILMVGLAAQ